MSRIRYDTVESNGFVKHAATNTNRKNRQNEIKHVCKHFHTKTKTSTLKWVHKKEIEQYYRARKQAIWNARAQNIIHQIQQKNKNAQPNIIDATIKEQNNFWGNTAYTTNKRRNMGMRRAKL